jgi:hypothetical protein
MSDKIKEALLKLDPANENHWTDAGLARLETVKFNMGGTAVSREELDAAFPGFSKDTAATYEWPAAQPGSGAPQGTETAGGEQGSTSAPPAPPAAPQAAGAPETPSAAGEGAAPVEQAPEPPVGPAGGDAGGETELEALVEGLDDLDDGDDEVALLEKTFQEIQEHIAGLRGQVDDLNLEIDRVAQIEQKVSNAINKAKRGRNDHKPANAIQEYLASQKRLAAQRGANRKTLAESGLNLKELAKAIGKSPLDQSMARPTARRGRGSSGM